MPWTHINNLHVDTPPTLIQLVNAVEEFFLPIMRNVFDLSLLRYMHPKSTPSTTITDLGLHFYDITIGFRVICMFWVCLGLCRTSLWRVEHLLTSVTRNYLSDKKVVL
jgi:hypothetical protein